MNDNNASLGGESAISRELYGELHRLAVIQFRRQPAGHTLQPTALVNEAFLRLAGKSPVQERAHFLALAARVMRQVLVDHARKLDSAKHGAGWQRVTLNSPNAQQVEQEGLGLDVDILDLEAALEELHALNADHAHLVELRFFGGLTIEETAGVLSISTTEVQRRWRIARAWLGRALQNKEAL